MTEQCTDHDDAELVAKWRLIADRLFDAYTRGRVDERKRQRLVRGVSMIAAALVASGITRLLIP